MGSIARSKFEGHEILSITRDDGREIRFGQSVARVIVNNIDAVRNWITALDAEKAKKAKSTSPVIKDMDMAEVFAQFQAYISKQKKAKK